DYYCYSSDSSGTGLF
nr:immunoglobulin light chain junction region [Macaca mulatta]